MTTQPEDIVRADLGDQTAETYQEAVVLACRGSEESAGELGARAAQALEMATDLFVSTLKNVPENKLQSGGYAELLLAYGKALLVYVRREALRESVLAEEAENDIKTSGSSTKFIDVADGALDEEVEIVGDKLDAEEGEEDDDDDEDKDDGEEAGKAHDTKTTKSDINAVTGDEPQPIDEKVAKAKESEGDAAPCGPSSEENTKVAANAPTLSVNHESAQSPHASSLPKPSLTATTEGKGSDEKLDGVIVDQADENEEEDISTAELAWEQFEHARLIYENIGSGFESRLSAVHEAQGDFLAETDGNDVRAAEEYKKAAEVAVKAAGFGSRRVADLYHRMYLSLRKEQPVEAIQAMESAVGAFQAFVLSPESAEEDAQTLELMRQDLTAFKESLGSALTTVIGFRDATGTSKNGHAGNGHVGEADSVTPVPREIIPVMVQPKRRGVRADAAAVLGHEVQNPSSHEKAEEPAQKRMKVLMDPN